MGHAVYENIYTRMVFLDVLEHGANLIRLRHIGGEKITLDLLRDLSRILFVARMHAHWSAFTSERPGNRQTDVMCRTGHQCDFIFEQHFDPLNNFGDSSYSNR